MRLNIKAALMSAFVLPGLGQIYKGDRRKGIILVILVNFFLLAALWLVMQGVGQLVLATGNHGGIDAGHVMEQLQQHSPLARLLLAGFFCLWIYAVVDAALAKCNGGCEPR
ncbi:MAG: hypothetical protein CXR31_03220 [Geobacter sp.]|nr:MAG: hypothetical protein CXR31_03220 [Geobacter sp.]